MADEREKTVQKDQETIIPGEAAKDELSEEELAKASGGKVIDKTSPLLF